MTYLNISTHATTTDSASKAAPHHYIPGREKVTPHQSSVVTILKAAQGTSLTVQEMGLQLGNIV